MAQGARTEAGGQPPLPAAAAGHGRDALRPRIRKHRHAGTGLRKTMGPHAAGNGVEPAAHGL